MSEPVLAEWIDRVQAARASRSRLTIRGGGTKDFYGEAPQGDRLETASLTGIRSYEPSELVVSVRAGTPLAELESALADQGQCLPFDAPRFAPGGTVGGMVAAGLAGPARAAVGGVRDYVLGATLLNGRAEVLTFGGQVMKNVAGYDISRLMVGSLGVLGVLCEVSLKVLPVAPAQATLRFEMAQKDAIRQLNQWAGQPLPVNASAWWEGMLLVRLSGAQAAVQSALTHLGGEIIDGPSAAAFWAGLRDHQDEFFVGAAKAVEGGAALWRLSLPQVTQPLELNGQQLIEWGGGLRWLCTALPAAVVREAATAAGGHATLFRARDKSAGVFTPLATPLDRLHLEMTRAFDPDGVFDSGRMYAALAA